MNSDVNVVKKISAKLEQCSKLDDEYIAHVATLINTISGLKDKLREANGRAGYYMKQAAVSCTCRQYGISPSSMSICAQAIHSREDVNRAKESIPPPFIQEVANPFKDFEGKEEENGTLETTNVDTDDIDMDF
jgi:hypothetical protein